jgi:hypothetical protein
MARAGGKRSYGAGLLEIPLYGCEHCGGDGLVLDSSFAVSGINGDFRTSLVKTFRMIVQ